MTIPERLKVMENPALYHTSARVLTHKDIAALFKSNPSILAISPAVNIDPVHREPIFREDFVKIMLAPQPACE